VRSLPARCLDIVARLGTIVHPRVHFVQSPRLFRLQGLLRKEGKVEKNHSLCLKSVSGYSDAITYRSSGNRRASLLSDSRPPQQEPP